MKSLMAYIPWELVKNQKLVFVKDYRPGLEKAMATHSSTLAWEIPWTKEPGRLQSMGSQRVGHDWVAKWGPAEQLHFHF